MNRDNTNTKNAELLDELIVVNKVVADYFIEQNTDMSEHIGEQK